MNYSHIQVKALVELIQSKESDPYAILDRLAAILGGSYNDWLYTYTRSSTHLTKI